VSVGGAPLRVHRIPFSTNVERVALACAHKGVLVEWVDHRTEDRSAILELSGQPLVPVAETPDGPLADSAAILHWLEETVPDPPLWPQEPARRAEADVFVEWFNRVWKGPPNALVERADRGLELALEHWLHRFERLLAGRPFLLGGAFGIADAIAFPFLKYPVLGLPEGDQDPFHQVLVDTMPDPGPELRAWVDRVDALPRA
jgi:glutathione S-transferase